MLSFSTHDLKSFPSTPLSVWTIPWVFLLWPVLTFVFFTSGFIGFNYSSAAAIIQYGMAPLLVNWKPAAVLILVVAFALYLALQIQGLLQRQDTAKHGRIALLILAIFTVVSLSVWIFPGWIGLVDYRTEIRKIDIATRLLPRVIAMLPSLQSILLESPIYLVYGILTGIFAGWLKARLCWRTAYTRKIFHVFIFTMAGFLQIVRGIDSVALFGGAIFFCVVYAVVEG